MLCRRRSLAEFARKWCFHSNTNSSSNKSFNKESKHDEHELYCTTCSRISDLTLITYHSLVLVMRIILLYVCLYLIVVMRICQSAWWQERTLPDLALRRDIQYNQHLWNCDFFISWTAVCWVSRLREMPLIKIVINNLKKVLITLIMMEEKNGELCFETYRVR